MDGKFQTSFIPKKPITETQSYAGGNTVSIFSLLAILIFIVVALSSGAVYFWKNSLESQSADKSAQLKKAQASYEPATIQRLIRTDARIKSATEILSNHISPSLIFSVLEDNTLKNVRFKSFEYLASANGTVAISMKGQAKNFSTIALQSDVFAENKYIKNPILSDLSLDSSGLVSFNFTASLDKNEMLYSKNLQSYGITVPTQ